MAKVKIITELDIDFQKFFDEIPPGLFVEKEPVDNNYITEVIYDVLNDAHLSQIQNGADWLTTKNDYYTHVKHHLDIATEVAKQMKKNVEIIIEP